MASREEPAACSIITPDSHTPLAAVVFDLADSAIGLVEPDLAGVVRAVAGNEETEILHHPVARAEEQNRARLEVFDFTRGKDRVRRHGVATGECLVGPGAVHLDIEL